MPEMRVMMGMGRGVADILTKHGFKADAGDTRIMWDAGVQTEVDSAKKVFDDLRARGYMAYAVLAEGGGKGEIVTTFDPAAQKLILAPPMAGG